MVDRTIIEPMEQMRDFDFVMDSKDGMLAIGGLARDVFSQLGSTVVAGLAAIQTSVPSLSIQIGPGRIYSLASADLTAVGSIPQDLTLIAQQGFTAGQTITLIPPSSGQSQWNLIQAQFSQVDAIRSNDPNGGNTPFYNPANPSQPTTNTINTVRKAVCVLQVITGSAATTGSEAPPAPTTGWVPVYLIDLAGGQTQIATSQILLAGPSVGTGVSSVYPGAPLLTGLLASHHGGVPGQAPKIKLGSEVQGTLPYANMSPVRTLLTSNLTLYVNNGTGSDTNAGTTPSLAFKTIQAAVNAIYHNYDFNGFTATISVANGAYATQTTLVGLPVGMSSAINIVGNTASPGSVTISVVNGSCFVALQGAYLSVSGVQMGSSGSAASGFGFCLSASNGALIQFGSINFGACSNAHMFASNGGSIFNLASLGLNYTILGGSLTHMWSDSGATISASAAVVTITNTPGFGTAFALAQRCSTMQAVGATYSGAATGSRYAVSTNATLTVGGSTTFFPGNAVGTTASGGIYA